MRVRWLGTSHKFPKEETAVESTRVSEPVGEVSFVFVIVSKVVVEGGVPLFNELVTQALQPVSLGGDLVVVLRGGHRLVHSLVIILSTQLFIVLFEERVKFGIIRVVVRRSTKRFLGCPNHRLLRSSLSAQHSLHILLLINLIITRGLYLVPFIPQ